jgi:NAD(P)-dependent dehydrogenase (short-subunit alcohol dehydrogenase family)
MENFMAPFKDQVIIVTGASEGIGRALCLALASQGPRLVLVARNERRLKELKEDVQARGAHSLVIPADITQEGSCKALMEKTIAEWGRLDTLVNNAGMTMWAKLEEITDTSVFERIMRLNYLGSVYCTYYALPHLKASQGRIVTIAAVGGLTGIPTRTAYAASKHALFGFFESLRIELEGTGVTVTMVAPDFVLSEIHRRALTGDGAPLGKSPLQAKKIMTADQCASLILPAMEKRSRLLLTSRRGRLTYWLKTFAPRLVDHFWIKAIQKKK